jgi:aminoglycoside phosphotransferase (APT) family kinase protein
LHQTVTNLLGGPVTRVVSQSNGFSPGSADRVVTADGRRAFVKAVRRDRNPGTYHLHSREISVMAAMPAGVRAPTLLGSYRTADWVALILSDIDGRHPGESLDGSDVGPVLDALGTFSTVPAHTLGGLPRAADEFRGEAAGWAELEADDALGVVPPWVHSSFDRLRGAADAVAAAVEGESLLHLDCRADNVLIDPAGAAWVIDWPWASIGASWVDGLTYLLDARLRGERVDADALLREHPLFAGVPADSIDAVLAAITGYFFNKARQPAPPNMPALRDFQRREALAGTDWLHERWG